MPGSEFRTLLDTFNDRWVGTGRFFSINVLMELLRETGGLTIEYYEAVDPGAPGEPVGFFGVRRGQSSPFWHAIGREYIERWVHHSQIRRALSLPSVSDRDFLVPGVEVTAAAMRLNPRTPATGDGEWGFGEVVLGSSQQAADILTRAHTTREIHALAKGAGDV